MMKMMKKFILIISWLLVLTCMGLIFFFSSQVSEKSSETSGRTLEIVINIIRPLIDDMPETQQFNITENIHVVIRKVAHATIYMILAFLSSNAVYMQNYFFNEKKDNAKEKKFYKYKNSLITFIIAVLYAASDELHQLFVDGRSCEFRDVMIDSAGALVGIFLYILVFRLILKSREKSRQKKYRSEKTHKVKL